MTSLLGQTVSDWELIIVDGGSRDETASLLGKYLGDDRIRYVRLEMNGGMAAALNWGLDEARGRFIAYLPSDDVYYSDHLWTLVDALEAEPHAPMAYTGIRHHYNRFSRGRIEGCWLQLVQVLHRRTSQRWIEREELVSDDLDRLFWDRLGAREQFVGTGVVTCEWVDHPDQLHKLLQEPIGGINTYRSAFHVSHPMRFHSTEGSYIDEVDLYRSFRDRPDTPACEDSLKIVLCGELAYNAERVLALEERGHQLFGLWMSNPYWYNTVGPLPFGHVTDLPERGWREVLSDLKPDLIYAQLNWQAVPFVHEVLRAVPDIPLVWHFKEGPFICLEKGTWPMLVDLYTESAGVIYCNPEMQRWIETAIPGANQVPHTMVLDGDLPKAEWLRGSRSGRPGDWTGFHTVVPGRPIGLHPSNMAELAGQDIHLHFYGDFTHGQWKQWIQTVSTLAPDHLHLHPQVDQRGWVSEFSKYDAGWLHYFESKNQCDIARADWDDLNYPARLTTLVAAGLPLLQRENSTSLVAAQSLVRDFDMGVFFTSMEELKVRLGEHERMNAVRANVWENRKLFTFDHHADRLISFFRTVISPYR